MDAVQNYEDKVRRVKSAGNLAGGLQRTSFLIAIWTLCFSTLVLVGFYLHFLRYWEIYLIPTLVLLEILRYYLITWFGSYNVNNDAPKHLTVKHREVVLYYGCTLQAFIIISETVLTTLCLLIGGVNNATNGLYYVFVIFYNFVYLNCTTAIIATLCLFWSVAWVRNTGEFSLECFYDETFNNAMKGEKKWFVEDVFIIMCTRMFQGWLCMDCFQGVRPVLMKTRNSEFIFYLEKHPRGRDHLCMLIRQGGFYTRLVATYFAGFVFEVQDATEIMDVNLELIKQLLNVLYSGQICYHAVNSLIVLADKLDKTSKLRLARMKVRYGETFLDFLGKALESGSLLFTRFMFILLQPELDNIERFTQKLRDILENENLKGRVKILAATTLKNVDWDAADIAELVEGIKPENYIPTREAYMLDSLRKWVGADAYDWSAWMIQDGIRFY